MPSIYKFSETATETHGTPKTLDRLKEIYMEGAHTQIGNLLNDGVEKVMGWVYDYTDVLKRYYYTLNGHCYKAYAPNKTCLRKSIYGTISDIVEIK